jgi:hypothetical protein
VAQEKTPVPLAQSLWVKTESTLSTLMNVLIAALAKTVAPLAQSTNNRKIDKERLGCFAKSFFVPNKSVYYNIVRNNANTR